ncbi:DUF2147 domain-containing protein [Aureibacter tunicatorum]|uniref:Uncharacterized protein (DUF2147 family) n=1 Tax=Aureibacter tunicatorum TaxID=866807 RepID=A0AAE3XPV4_9BACT|nr:DUF2147 domain-containing protein [Aureibacter tunicatorum]MDR6240498.1 uncharacterized protein (DUF2147 family) [Aureibacter tunicatorum]
MKKLVVFLLFLFSSVNIFAQDKVDEILGVWEIKDKTAKMEVFKCGEEYCGKLLWGKDIVEKDGVTSKKDVKNPDPNLRSRDIVGITYLKGLTFDGDEYVNGRIYNSSNGKTYKCYVWFEDDILHLRGYLGLPTMGQTTKWFRIK